MNKSFKNLDVLKFYKKLPFNYYQDIDIAAKSIRNTDFSTFYPVLPSIFKKGVKVLDVGCGVCFFVNAINFNYMEYGSSAEGIEYNLVAIKKAAEKKNVIAEPRVNVNLGDMTIPLSLIT